MPMEPQPTKAVEIFYSYAHNKQDEDLKDKLLKQLSGVERRGVIVSWNDRKITAGREWAGEIDDHINTAGVILLLVSADFIASGYCNDVELKRALERHDAGEARVIPVILRPTLWRGESFGKLQMLPTDARPLTLWENRDEALLNVAEGIQKAVEEVAKQTDEKEGGRRPIVNTNIPRPPVVGFVARRDAEGRDIVKYLTEELAPEKNQLVALWGPGGTGKTTLAAEVVRATTNVFKGRVAWVSALGRADFNVATLLDEIAAQLGREELRKLAPEMKAAQVAALVAARLTLVVLDNFETIAEEAQGHCLDFLAQSAACPALVTTRSFVNHDDVSNVPLAAMKMEEAREFLQRLAERTRTPSNFDRLDRDDLIQRCEANPLVLQWVVRQIDLAQRPEDVLIDLAEGTGDAAERVFTRSFNLPQVGDDGRAALLALSLFTPHASREALAKVSDFGDDLHRLDRAVEDLSALWLIEATEGNERLFLRGLTRELAKSRLSKDGGADEFRRRYIAHFLQHAVTHPQPTPEDLNALEAEKGNVLGAMDAASESKDWQSVMRICDALKNFLFLHGYWDEAIRSGGQAEAAAREAKDDLHVARFMGNVARIRSYRGEHERAGKVYREALEMFRDLGSDKNVAICLHQLGFIAQIQGDLVEARRLYGESLEINKRLGIQRGVAYTLHQLGRLAQIEGNLREARRLYDESLEINKRLGIQEGLASNLHQLAVLAEDVGEMKEAKRLNVESLEIKKKLGKQHGVALSLGNLGLIAVKEGDKTGAIRLFREALSIFEKLGSPEAENVRKDLADVEGETD